MPADPTPPDRASWLAKQAANSSEQKNAQGKRSSVTAPCPFCGEPKWFDGNLVALNVQITGRNGIVCNPRAGATPCGRTLAMTAGGAIAQIGGIAPPNYPPLNRIPQALPVIAKAAVKGQ